MKLKNTFESRTYEFFEEDREYKTKYKDIVLVKEPFLYLKIVPNKKIYGDHDLFCFADYNGEKPLITENKNLYERLRKSKRFQAQHGGIFYWEVKSDFENGIKTKIMAAHTEFPNLDIQNVSTQNIQNKTAGTEPLIVITPEYIKAAFFQDHVDRRQAKLVSVWDIKNNSAWLKTTWSGERYLLMKADYNNNLA